jgi:hypothetical protein
MARLTRQLEALHRLFRSLFFEDEIEFFEDEIENP